MIEAGQAIHQAIAGISLDEYGNSRLIRSSVEREFITIGEALTQLSQRDQALFGEIEPAPQIISFRNKLTHEYININNQLVWGVIKTNLPVLVDQCRQLLDRLDRELP
ncbi:DUF86 domain-containing protein [Cyanobium sp. ATX 6E8]|uniref:HepT-like ribonuclease domain-containing protein n=1 Tax=Cyanobium sp. ATX 6E8 TaxID=2823701 RepID=UPI0020CDCA0C|nr:HepT-like ribonuclease domain-containing protein [Cyanobium sp. ATX 6E8]MCP9940997.1 DUF86 domain-containing protein [Cyanobium sp. ATX 6E8]